MEDFSEYFNPIQREYIYNVCKRLSPYLDKFDNSIRQDDKKVIILKILIDSFVDENAINKPANKSTKGSISKRTVKRLTRTDNVLYKKENIDK